MLEHEHQLPQHHDESTSAPAVHEPQPAVEHAQSVQQIPPAASFAELTGQPKGPVGDKAVAEPPLANTDAVIEQLAHGMVAKDLDDNDQRFLAANGYAAQPI